MAKTTMISPLVFLTIFSRQAIAHGHDLSKIVAGEVMDTVPMDLRLRLHIFLMIFSFGFIFPIGMVLGMVKSRWHVPTQVVGTVIAVPAYLLAHLHKGRAYAKNIHSTFGNYLMLLLTIQILFGIYLKFHITKGFHGKIRKVAVVGHGFVGKSMPVLAWTQLILGGITSMGFCREDHLGQCLAHFIMGSAFIGYGTLMIIIMLAGQVWLQRVRKSPEFFDSVVIAAWGCVNTFTEHRWGNPWVANDVQHTTMGVVWWCAGLAGIWLSKKRNGSPKRNFVPGFVIFLTGWAMSAHPQHLPLSTMIHTVFGYTLMAAGLVRIIEVAFVLKDLNSISEDGEAHSFQYISPFLLYASGFLFMGATEEQMKLLSDAGISHVSYVLILYSISFLLFLFANILLHIYTLGSMGVSLSRDEETTSLKVKGQDADADDFELEDLMDEYDSVPESPKSIKKERDLYR